MRMSGIGVVFAAICAILAVLLLTGVVSVVVSGMIFAVALVVCGVAASRWLQHR